MVTQAPTRDGVTLRLTLTLLGGFQVRVDPGVALTLPSKKAQALLAYLALPPGRAHPRGKLSALLWGDMREEQARSGLRQALFALRKALKEADPLPISLDGETVSLDPAAVDVDVAAFEQEVAQGAPDALERAVALYHGDLLEGAAVREAAFEEWLMAERERLRELVLEALARLLAHQRRAGAPDAAIRTAVRLLALDPLQEPVHRTLMRLYAQLGRRGAALRQYQHCVSVLQRELAAAPEAETKRLYREILQRRAARETATEGSATIQGPRPGAVRTRFDAPSVETPLIGRESELARLREALESARRGRGQLLALLGEAGIGKSRLIAELAIEAPPRGARVLVGRSYESEQILPFAPWADALRTGGVIHDVEVLADLSAIWRTELTRLLPELGMDPHSGAEDGEYLRLFEGVAQLVSRLAARQPLVLVLEDLHWADEMSLRLLAFLGRRLQSWPVLVLITAREEELADAPVLRRALGDLTREQRLVPLTLAPLSRADTLSLLRVLARAGSQPAAVERLGDRLWVASRGNPLIVVETMRGFRDDPAPEALSELPLPWSVREVIARRLERLGERGQALVAVAAVIAREFDFDLLQRAAGLAEEEAAEGVEELVRRRVLHGVGEHFDFPHERIREVAYGQLVPPRRRLLHRRVAESLESLYADRLELHYAALGLHYREGEVWDKAVSYLRRAGAQAVSRSAYREALAWFEQALETAARLPDGRDTLEQAIDIRTDLYSALLPLGEPRRIGEHLRQAEAFARALADQVRLGRVAAYATNSYWLVGDFDRAVESGQRALGIAEALGDVGLRVVSSFYLGQVYHFRGDYRQAIGVLKRNLELLEGDRPSERFGLPGLPSVLARDWLAWSLSEAGEFAEGIVHAEEAVRIAGAADHAFSMADACRAIGCLYIRKGDIPEAVGVLERGLELCRTRDLALWSPSIGSALGYAYAQSGSVEAAGPLLEQAVEQAASLGITAGHALRLAWLGEAYLLAGRVPDAIRLADRALELSRERKERGHQAWARRLVGEIASRQERPDLEKAEASYRAAIALAEELGMRPLRGHCLLGLGVVHGKRGAVEEARATLAGAIDLFRSMEMTYWLSRAEGELAKAAGPAMGDG